MRSLESTHPKHLAQYPAQPVSTHSTVGARANTRSSRRGGQYSLVHRRRSACTRAALLVAHQAVAPHRGGPALLGIVGFLEAGGCAWTGSISVSRDAISQLISA